MTSAQPSPRPLLLLLCLLGLPAPALAQGFFSLSTSSMGDDFTTLSISHRDPNYVMVGTVRGTILQTLDGGSTWQQLTVSPSRSVFYGRERQPDPSWEYAPGLPGKSPYLQSWLRRSGLATSGVNMAQLLYTKGDKQVAINWIEVDWHDESTVYVGTPDGLYRSRDRGRSFVRIFQGVSNLRERMVNAVATDPSDPRRLMVGTGSGVFISEDGGRVFKKTMDYYLRDSHVREIWFDPNQPGLVHVALAGSAMASPDSGQHWITTHWTDWAPRADVQSFSLGPGNLRLIGTRDGIWASFQGGEMGTWQRRGIRFVGTVMGKVMATRDPNTWYAMTDQAIWVTEDAGNNWRKVVQTGGREAPRWMSSFDGSRQQMWLLTNRQVLRVGPPPGQRLYDLSMRASPSLLQIPDLFELAQTVIRRHRIHFAVTERYRDRSQWAALLPSLSAEAHYATARDMVNIQTYQFASFPFTYYNSALDGGLTWQITAKWDLGRLISSKERIPHWGRIERNHSGLRQEILERVHRLYVEYRRVARQLVYAPPAELVARQFLELRLQEITAYLDALSGGAWSKRIAALNSDR